MPPELMNCTWRARLQGLDKELWQSRAFWQPAPYRATPVWTATHPALTHWLESLTLDDVDALEADEPALRRALAHWLPCLEGIEALTHLPALAPKPRLESGASSSRLSWDIPGRKWQQILAFCEHVDLEPEPLVDWCAGKGHLARTASLLGNGTQPVLALERDPALVAEGEALAVRRGARVRFLTQDVLASPPAVTREHHVMALHACGDLHRHLMELAPHEGVPRLSIAPCCYHKGAQLDPFNPDLVTLRLSRQDMRLAVEQTVTAPTHERRHHHRAAAWRWALITWWERQGREGPLPGRWPTRLFRDDFAGFIQHACTSTGLPPPPDHAALAREGQTRYERTRRLELVRHAFRRPLEVWLCLDRAVWLARQGYTVEVGTFCGASLTPRNLLIRASLAGDVLAQRHGFGTPTQTDVEHLDSQ